jgi:hypothetical protein
MPIIAPITPKQLYAEAVSIAIDNVIFRFGEGDQYAFCGVAYVDANGNAISGVQVNFTADELATWGSNDEVLAELVQSKLGL